MWTQVQQRKDKLSWPLAGVSLQRVMFLLRQDRGPNVWENQVTEKHSFRIPSEWPGHDSWLYRTWQDFLAKSEGKWTLSVALNALKEKTLRLLFGLRCTECSLRYIDPWLKNVFKSLCYRGAKIPCASHVDWILYCRASCLWVLVLSPFWRLEFWGRSWIFGKFVYPCVSTLCSVSVRFLRGR